MSKQYSVVTATVKNVADPEKRGRVRVSYKNLPEGNESYWVPVATMMSGPDRGSWFMPEPGDDVLVAFANGNVTEPYIVGFLWNGEQKPPLQDDIDTKVRRLRTVKGHVLEFDDRDNSEKISLRFQDDKPSIELDSSTVSITMPSNHSIVITDGGSITVSFDSSNSIELSSSGITLTGTQIDLNATSGINITATGEVKVEGALIKLN